MMVIVCQYRICKDEDGTLRMLNVPASFCPDCRERLRSRDSRVRGFLDTAGEKHLLRHRRLICRKCGRIHSEMPDFIVPEKRYTAGAVLGAFSLEVSDSGENSQSCAAEDSTIAGWILQIFCRIQVIFSFARRWFCVIREREFAAHMSDLLDSLTEGNLIRENYGEYIRWLYSIDHHICCVE